MAKITITQGDITKLAVDAIVNAANPTLLGGAGVDGAIHMAAGPQLREECATLGGCNFGEAKITEGYNLPAKHIIHTVGPIWYGGNDGEDDTLARCYLNSLTLAAKHGCRTIAFPAISTGAFGFPVERATRLALREMMSWGEFVARPEELDEIICVCFDYDVHNMYKLVYSEYLEEHSK